MLMVVLGAGASYDSAVEVIAPLGDTEFRPPLTDHLFTNRGTYLPTGFRGDAYRSAARWLPRQQSIAVWARPSRLSKA